MFLEIMDCVQKFSKWEILASWFSLEIKVSKG